MKYHIFFIFLIVLIVSLPVLALDIDGDALSGYTELLAGSNPLKADSDGDGLSDGEELKIDTSPLSSDTDGDGLDDLKETRQKTNPIKEDSDNDGIGDGEELKLGTDPLNTDTDGDGLSDGEELRLATDPLLYDTDGDSLSDGEEETCGSNPLNKDTDGDGLDDYFEISNSLNPLNTDTDGDGLSDGEELKLGIDPASNDTDGDGLIDYDEVIEYGTFADKKDSDGDGVTDSRELQLGLDPLNTDSDNDGLSDGYEVNINTDPKISWRGLFTEDAIKSALSDIYLKEVLGLSKQLDGESYVDKAWNVLEWVDENIEYDYSKADDVQNATLQTPFETVKTGKGICTDYSILTAALLLNLNINPVYILDIEYENNVIGHTAAAIKIDGEYFVLDQHLPPIHLGAYYYTSLLDGNVISEIKVYEIRKDIMLEVRTANKYTGNQIKKMLYTVGDKDLKNIQKAITERFIIEKDWFKEDTRLKDIAESELECKKSSKTCPQQYLPSGFSKGVILTIWEMTYYYHPVFLQKFADMIIQEFEELENMSDYKSLYFAVGSGKYEFNTYKHSSTESSTEPAIIVVGCFAR
jgi:predicted transglutaminase-like protease